MSSLERKLISAILNHNRHRHRRRRNHNDNIQYYYVWATAASADLFDASLVARRSSLGGRRLSVIVVRPSQ